MKIETNKKKIISELREAKVSQDQIETAVKTSNKLLESLRKQEILIAEDRSINEIFQKYLKEN
tara:strand:+ start:208 stop:396 length:189 start_codon:yes stop_codon:yes gene_type:complete